VFPLFLEQALFYSMVFHSSLYYLLISLPHCIHMEILSLITTGFTMRKILPPTYFLMSIVLIVILHYIYPFFLLIAMPWSLLGLLPITIGICLNLLADRQMKKQNTTVKPFQKSSSLIKGGVFRISRNPMYLGMATILFGVAFLLDSISPFVVVVCFMVIMNFNFIKNEETMLEDIFGDAYLQYQKKVRKWI